MPETTRPQPRISRRMRKSRDWYVVLYQLAAQRTNHALSSEVPDEDQLAKADGECWRLVTAAATTLSRRRHRVFLDDTGLLRFLDEIVLPSACVLWAGIMVERGEKPGARETVTHASLMGGRRPAPVDLVAFAVQRPVLPYRVRYNVACFHAAVGDLRAAEAQLREAIDSVFGTTRAYIATKALHDSSLADLVAEPDVGSYLRAVAAQTRLDERG